MVLDLAANLVINEQSMEGPVPRDIVCCLFWRFGHLHNLMPLMRVNRFWHGAVIDFIVHNVSKVAFEQAVRPFAQNCVVELSAGGTIPLYGNDDDAVYDILHKDPRHHREFFNWFMLATCHNTSGEQSEALSRDMSREEYRSVWEDLWNKREHYKRLQSVARNRGLELLTKRDANSIFSLLMIRHGQLCLIATAKTQLSSAEITYEKAMGRKREAEASLLLHERVVADLNKRIRGETQD